MKTTLLGLDLIHSDSNEHVKYNVYWPLTLESTFLAMIKKVVKICETRDFRVGNN